MGYRTICEELQFAWNDLSAKWSAEIKEAYYRKIFLPLISEAENVYVRNEELEREISKCLRSLNDKGK